MESIEYPELGEEDLKEGFLHCMQNSARLRAAAFREYDAGEFGLTTFLGILRIEEVGKAAMLFDARRGELYGGSWKSFWKAFRSHGPKWHVYMMRTKNQVKGWTPEEREAKLREAADQTASFKNWTMYVSYQANKGRWVTPGAEYWKDEARDILFQSDDWDFRFRGELRGSPWEALLGDLPVIDLDDLNRVDRHP